VKPRFDDRVIRPGGRRYNIFEKTDLARTFARIRSEQREIERERSLKVKPLERKRA
jgi:hypothetical protein